MNSSAKVWARDLSRVCTWTPRPTKPNWMARLTSPGWPLSSAAERRKPDPPSSEISDFPALESSIPRSQEATVPVPLAARRRTASRPAPSRSRRKAPGLIPPPERHPHKISRLPGTGRSYPTNTMAEFLPLDFLTSGHPA